MPPNIPRQHHINPRVLLKGFADAHGYLLVASKEGLPDHLESIKSASVVRDANTIVLDAGIDVELERALSKVENHYPKIIGLLDKANRAADEHAQIVALVATQGGRDPWNRSFIGEEAGFTFDALRVALRDVDPPFSDVDIEAEIDWYARRNVVRGDVIPTVENVAKAGTPWLIEWMFKDLVKEKLTILRASGTGFITADSALSLHEGYTPLGTTVANDTGFQEETELLLPITPRHAALITHGFTRELIDVSDDVVAIVNARTARAAACDVYAHPTYSRALLATAMGYWWLRRPLLGTL